MTSIPSLDRLVKELSRFPGIGLKTASRLAYHLIQSKDNMIEDLSEALKTAQQNIDFCSSCFCFLEKQSECSVCSDPLRTKETICVLENPQDIFQIESAGVYKGQYHILHGLISPLRGVRAENLRIESLLQRVKAPVNEVILAFNATLEGDTTSLFLSERLKDRGVKISRIAHGIPIGGDLDYIDYRTLSKALENRVEV